MSVKPPEWPVAASKHARTKEEAVLIAGGPVVWPREEREQFTPDLAFIRGRMPDRLDRHAYLLHALRHFEDVLAYAERLESA